MSVWKICCCQSLGDDRAAFHCQEGGMERKEDNLVFFFFTKLSKEIVLMLLSICQYIKVNIAKLVYAYFKSYWNHKFLRTCPPPTPSPPLLSFIVIFGPPPPFLPPVPLSSKTCNWFLSSGNMHIFRTFIPQYFCPINQSTLSQYKLIVFASNGTNLSFCNLVARGPHLKNGYMVRHICDPILYKIFVL